MSATQNITPLYQVALLGAANSAEDLSLLANDLGLKHNGELEPSAQLLELLAQGSLLWYSGSVPSAKRRPEQTPLLEEQRNKMPRKATLALQKILLGKYKDLLSEFLRICIAHNIELPSAAFPLILEATKNKKELTSLAANATGQKGQLLAKANPNWKHLLVDVLDTDWEQAGTAAEKADYLVRMARLSFEKAIATLAQLSGKELQLARQALLASLRAPLSADELAFLQNMLLESNSETQLAARKAAALAEPAYAEKLWLDHKHWVQSQFRLLGSNKLIFDLPELGGPNEKIKKKSEAHLGWEPLSLIPPRKWSESIGLKPLEIWKQLAEHPQHAAGLVRLLADAALLHKDEEWLEALGEAVAKYHTLPTWNRMDCVGIFKQMPEKTFQKAMCHMALEMVPNANDDSSAMRILMESDKLWNLKLTNIVVKHLQSWLAGGALWYLNSVRNLVKRCGVSAHVDALPQLDLLLNEVQNPAVRLEVQEMISTVRLRKEYHLVLSIK